ncbi:uncharacterized protein LOC110987816 [Acanthaster planci]|uniref:Uncharacterized protein LOC110987816 n=1 Tax=Acanthaster planci TaxID=133434 RepID=A0A8B7ZT21_ACAPL|nr:uncharacterized protein LOC110987816 [Acanthaster planci]
MKIEWLVTRWLGLQQKVSSCWDGGQGGLQVDMDDGTDTGLKRPLESDSDDDVPLLTLAKRASGSPSPIRLNEEAAPLQQAGRPTSLARADSNPTCHNLCPMCCLRKS